jgi:energy-coupling factor transport system ATP-binding protein
MEIVGDYAKRALVLSGGRLVADCGAREVMRNREVLELASLLPAQIPSLAMRLGDLGGDFAGAFTVAEMAEAVEAARTGARREMVS